MKTTVEIADPLLAEARKLAAAEKTTVRALIEEGLRKVLAARRKPGTYKMPDCTFHGDGLRPELQGASWAELRAIIYEGRGE